MIKKMIAFTPQQLEFLESESNRCGAKIPEIVRHVLTNYMNFRKEQLRKEYEMAIANKQPVEIEFLIEKDGELKPSPLYSHNSKLYTEGVDGCQYGIRVKNNTLGRIECVVSVDGLDIHDGKEASLSKNGLVLSAGEDYVFKGFRLNNDSVASFKFGNSEESYAEVSGKPKNIGVIGVATFEEKVKWEVETPRYMSDVAWGSPAIYGIATNSFEADFAITNSTQSTNSTRGMTKGIRSRKRKKSLGTVFGEKQADKVGTTTFERNSEVPSQLITIRYENLENLKELGVVPKKDDLYAREHANPFAETYTGCQPPAGWKG